ncbi:MAG: chorismate synthase [Candidatus Eisenbacteria bacterium]
MSSSFGRLFTVTTWGESHGPAVGVVVDGVPAGLALDPAVIQRDLDRRRPGQSAITTQRSEADTAVILSGLFEGRTTGTPISILAWNQDAQSKDYDALKDVYRPGHADFTYAAKYGIRDHRGSGRASGRETLGRVAAGAIAKALLATTGVSIVGGTVAVADVLAERRDWEIAESNAIRCPDAAAATRMIALIEAARAEKDSVGGVVEVVARGCPAGWGDPTMEKLDGEIARVLMSIPALKGVEIGDGFAATRLKGSQSNDAMGPDGFRSNRAGGILGGISTGADIVARVAVKPASSIGKPQETVNAAGEAVTIAVEGRHDPCICPRVVTVAEAMLAIALANAYLRQRSLDPKAGPWSS